MIRAITLGLPIYTESHATLASQLTAFRAEADALSASTGIASRTVRLTLPPPSAAFVGQAGTLRGIVSSVGDLAKAVGARWYCLPINLFDEFQSKTLLDEVLPLLVRDSKLFVNLMVADKESISLKGAQVASDFVLKLSRRSNTGIDCFRVGISAACPAGAPFFPYSRHEGEQAAFSIAMETTATALRTAEEARATGESLAGFQDKLIVALAAEMTQVEAFGTELARKSSCTYLGLDASLAPFPDGTNSVARIVEILGPTPVGSHGSVFITSVLTDALKMAAKRAGAKSVGFSGVMYSVLEDEVLSQATSLRSINLAKLALLSTVCGCGIDMVPVSGTMYAEEMAGLVLDIAAIAVRLEKPLGVRLLPIPNRVVNEMTQFNLDFLCDSRVMDSGTSAPKAMLDDEVWRYAGPRSGAKAK